MTKQKTTYEELESQISELRQENLLIRNKLEFHELFNQHSNVWETFRDINGKLIYVSPTFEKITGCKKSDYQDGTISLFDIVYPEDLEQMKIKFQSQIEGNSISDFECRICNKDGSIKYISLYSQPIFDPNGIYLGYRSSCIDITEQKHAAEKIKRLNRVYSVISAINQAIVHIRDKSILLNQICKIATELGDFRMAWIGFIDEKTGTIVPYTHAGFENAYLSQIVSISRNQNLAGSGPTGTAARTGQHFVCDDIASDPRMLIWKDEALARSYRSSISLPISVFRNVIGTFSLYSSTPNFFDEEEIELLDRVAGDIGFALQVIALEHDKLENVKKLHYTQQNLKKAQEIAKLGSWIYYPNGKLSWSSEMYHIFGVLSFEFTLNIDAHLSLVHPDDAHHLEFWFDNCLSGSNPPELEFRFIHPDHGLRFLITRGERVIDSQGNTLYIAGTTQDVTERMLAERSNRENEEKYRSLYENSGVPILLTAPDGRIFSANKDACRLFDRTEEEICRLGRDAIIDTTDPRLSIFLKERQLYGHAKSELWHLKKNGTRFPCEISSVVFMDKEGEEKTSLVFYDLTERQNAELALRKSEAELKEAQRIGKIANWSLDLKTKQLKYSEAYYHIFGIDPKLLSANLDQRKKDFTPESAARLSDVVDRSLKSGDPFEQDMELRKPMGGCLWCTIRGETVRDEKGIVIGLQGTILDITARKQAELELSKALDRTSAILRTSPHAIIVTDENGLLTLWNQAAQDIFGWTEEEVLGKMISDIQIEKTEEIQELRTRIMEGEVIRNYETVFVDKQKTKINVIFSASPLRNAHHDIVGILAIVSDITARKNAEDAIHRAEKYYRTLIEKAPDGIVLVGAEDRINYASPSAKRIFGFSDDETNFPSPAESTHPDDLPSVLGAIDRVIKDPSFVSVVEYRYKNKDGAWIWIESTFTNQLFVEGIESLVINFRNISERKCAEDELKESEHRYRTLFENMTEGFFQAEMIYDSLGNAIDFRFLDVNPAYSDILGFERDKVIGRTVNELFPGLERDWLEVASCVAGGGQSVYKEGYVQSIGHYYASSYFPSGSNQFASIFIDITDRKQTEKELTLYREHLEDLVKERTLELVRLNATKDKFFSIIAHDLKNPFSVLISSSELLLLYLDKNMVDKAQVKAKMIYDSSKRGFTLLQNLLEWSQSQIGSLRFNPIQLILKSFIDESLSVLESQALSKNIRIVNAIPDLLNLKADPNLLQVVVRNLITNAIKFTPSGGTIWVESVINEDSFEISVSDNGIGIPSDVQDKLFRIESKITSEGTNGEVGSGLGLVLCKEFVEKHGGKIWVESTLGEGSCFKFTIPSGIKMKKK